MRLRQHSAFAEIEADIVRYYEDGTVSATDTALKIAARALAVAATATPNDTAIAQAREFMFTILLDRQK